MSLINLKRKAEKEESSRKYEKQIDDGLASNDEQASKQEKASTRALEIDLKGGIYFVGNEEKAIVQATVFTGDVEPYAIYFVPVRHTEDAETVKALFETAIVSLRRKQVYSKVFKCMRNCDTTTLTLSNIPYQIEGWYCHCTQVSECLKVIGKAVTSIVVVDVAAPYHGLPRPTKAQCTTLADALALFDVPYLVTNSCRVEFL